jgi:tyrosine-specific transport protein
VNKQIGAICLVAGTCIGSGMIALPMVLAKLGIIPSVVLMLFIWLTMYYSALLNLELNLQVGEGLALGALGLRISGRLASYLGAICLKLLSYALLAAFINGSASIVQSMMGPEIVADPSSLNNIATCFAIVALLMLLLPMRVVSHINTWLFVALMAVVLLLIAGLIASIEWNHLPWLAVNYNSFAAWQTLIPVVFTSFGFQVIFHTMTNYCQADARTLKRAFFWGSLIPAVVYIIWTCSALSALHSHNASFYAQMEASDLSVGDLVRELSHIGQGELVQQLVWWTSLLALGTSIIGVGLGLCDALEEMFAKVWPHKWCRLLAALATLLPPYLTVILVPNAFIVALGFAGMVLTIIAIFLPLYLFSCLKIEKFCYVELKSKGLLALLALVGCIVLACELLNINF